MPTCHSTNATANRLVKNRLAAHGLIVVAGQQLAGKGQRGNQWLTEPFKNLTFSIVLDLNYLTPADIFMLNMAVGLAVLKAVQSEVRVKQEAFKVKWPNDIYYLDKKLGGILIETLLRSDKTFWAVVGIGLNVNQTYFGRLNASSLKNIDQKEFDLNALLEKVAMEIEHEINLAVRHNYENLKQQYLREMYRFNEQAHFKTIGGELFEGRITNIDGMGKIVIDCEGLLLHFDKQEVKFVK